MATFVRRARRAQSPRLTLTLPSSATPPSTRIDAWRLQLLLRTKLYPASCVTGSLLGGWFGVSEYLCGGQKWARRAGTSGRVATNAKGAI